MQRHHGLEADARPAVDPGDRAGLPVDRLPVDLHRHGGRSPPAGSAAAAEGEFAAVDVLLLPTVPDVPTVDAILADPYEGNYALGRYTTFVNLLGLSAVAVPGVGRSDGVPSGVSVVGRGGEDHLALDVASLIQREERSVWIGGGDRLPIVVVGAHLAGQPLNHQLTERGGRLELSTTT